jgi:hypothetical protein
MRGFGMAKVALTRTRAILAVFAAGATVSMMLIQGQASCDAQANPVACENQLPGNPAGEWDISGSGDSTIQGFATDISVNKGDTVHFKVDTTAPNFQIDIFRLGYYGGNGARKVATIPSTAGLSQANCLTSSTTGLVDCGNWFESTTWAVPATAVSGIYIAKLTRLDTGGASHIVFVVRDDAGLSDVLFQTSDTTWQAYNDYGGNSLYSGAPGTNPGRAYKVSYNRPFNTRGNSAQDWLFNAEYPMVRWLEANGYNVSYFTGVDTDRFGASLLTNHRVFMSTGHDEYWSGPQRANVEAARGAGVNLAFFSGNEVFWKTRWESSIDGTATPYRTLVSYKETHANAKIDPQGLLMWTGTWRDPRFSPPADGGRPENALTGTIFTVNCCSTTAGITVSQQFASQPFWRNTRVATLPVGGSTTLTAGTLGYEWDENLNTAFRPAGLIPLSSTTLSVAQKLQDYGSTYGPGTATHALTLYQHASGALVFGAGTVQWSWGLDGNHDRGVSIPDLAVQQATVNLLSDMGTEPGSLQPGLVSGGADATPPTVALTAPAAGSIVSGAAVTVSATAADNVGVAGVQFKLDGVAIGADLTAPPYAVVWNTTASTNGGHTLTAVAHDAAGNTATSASVTVTVSNAQAPVCPCSLWTLSTTPGPVANDAGAVELGMKFQSDTAGFITGLRFYKYSQNTGTHVGNLWTSGGTNLGAVTFANETASGWQQATLATPVAITANTTYVVSYHTNTGFYADTASGFTAAVDNAPLHGRSSASAGGNGVYAYGANTTFPNQTWNASNYWVDVVYATGLPADTTPPTVTVTTPAAGATGVPTTASLAATFSEALDATTITTSAIQLRDASNTLVTSTVTYNAATQTATLAPAAALATSSTYTATIKGGASGVKDLAGNSLASDYQWSFATAAPVACPCSVWTMSTAPGPLASDATAVEVGMKFQSDVAGLITGVRFYKYAQNTGTHIGHLWTASGTSLGAVTFANETAAGWQQATLAAPVAISANTTYIVSYHTNSGFYADTASGFVTSVDTGPLHWLASAGAGGNGVYAYGASATFPNQTWSASNYWVDVVLSTGPPDTTPPTVALTAPVGGATVTGTTAVAATAADNVAVAGVQFKLDGVNLGALATAAPYTLTWNSMLATNGAHTLTAVASDLAGNTTTSAGVTVTVSNAAPACPCSIWNAAAVPARMETDTNAVELGLKFTTDVAGSISGVRFYKYAQNTGTHTGSVWSVSGTRLGTVTFSGESASGWQQATFSSPIAVAANTTYIVSYHTNVGYYGVTGPGLSTAVDNAPLHALADGVAGGNGVYLYSAGGGFPNQTWNASNYWVDVVFTTP